MASSVHKPGHYGQRDMDCVVIQYRLGMGFMKAATCYCCSTGLAHFLMIRNRSMHQITWMYLDSQAPTDTRRLLALAARTNH